MKALDLVVTEPKATSEVHVVAILSGAGVRTLSPNIGANGGEQDDVGNMLLLKNPYGLPPTTASGHPLRI